MDLIEILGFVIFQVMIFFIWKKLMKIVGNENKKDKNTIKAFVFFHYLLAFVILLEGIIYQELEVLLYVSTALVFLILGVVRLKFIQRATITFFEDSFDDEQNKLNK